jgi:hypothetical protein
MLGAEMKKIKYAILMLFTLSGCDAVFHRYINISGSTVTVPAIHNVVVGFAQSANYECKEIKLPSLSNALECNRGIIVDITETDNLYTVRVSTQTAFYEPSSYTRFHEGLSKALSAEFGNDNVTVSHN